MNSKAEAGIVIAGFILLLLVAVLSTAYYLLYSLTSGQETITIKEKWVKYHNKDAKYLVSSTNGQVFEITDTIIKWRWDSSNLFAYIQPSQICFIKTQGWRFPLMSDYKNILTAECV